MQSDYGYFEEKKLGKPYDLKLLKRIYPFTGPYRLLLFGSIGLVLFITALDLALPYVTKIAIDRYIVPLTASLTPANATGEESEERGRQTRSKRQTLILADEGSVGEAVADHECTAGTIPDREGRLKLPSGRKHRWQVNASIPVD